VELLLLGNDGEVRGVDEGHDEGDVGIATVVLRVTEDCQFGGSECAFCEQKMAASITPFS